MINLRFAETLKTLRTKKGLSQRELAEKMYVNRSTITRWENGSRLLVEYDISHENFRIPPLTLQPIVENAVKHGMDIENTPFIIKIWTCETKSGNEIIIEDNGRGFDFKSDDNAPHIALKNIIQRLEMMCGGKMTIKPREGGGTIVKVTIPQQS